MVIIAKYIGQWRGSRKANWCKGGKGYSFGIYLISEKGIKLGTNWKEGGKGYIFHEIWVVKRVSFW